MQSYVEAFFPGEADVNLLWVNKVLRYEPFDESLGLIECFFNIGIVNVHPNDVHVKLTSVALHGAIDRKVISNRLPVLKQGGVAFVVAGFVPYVLKVNNSGVLVSALNRAID
jgi:hypothetical protein